MCKILGAEPNEEEIPVKDVYERGYYYTVGVTHNYEFGRDFRTTVNVDRGVSTKNIGDYKLS